VAELMGEISNIIMNEISEMHVVCASCRKSHFGIQTYFDKLKDYICNDCLENIRKEIDDGY
jgi:transposase-like protein